MAPEGNDGVVNDGSTGAPSGTTGSAAITSTGNTNATGSGTPPPVTKWEDDPRAKGILGDLQKERKARQQFEADLQAFKTRLEERDRQVAALTNSKVPSPEDAEADEIRNKFGSIVTREFLLKHLGLSPEDIEAFQTLKEQRGQIDESIKHHWTEHSRKMLDSVYEKVGAEVGDLTDRMKRKIASLYVAEAEADPAFLKRHDAGDKTLVEEFVKSYLEDTVEPVRRKVTATEANRYRPVPNGGNRTLPSQGGKQIDVNDDKAVMDLIMESRKGRFGR